MVQPTTAVATNVTINKMDAVITLDKEIYNVTYGDAAFTLNVKDNNPEADVIYSSSNEDVATVLNGTVTIKGAGKATITVSLAETTNYNTVETKVDLTVNKAKNTPNMPDRTMSVPYSTSTVGEVTLPGDWAWQDSDKTVELKVGVEVKATAVYTGSDAGNYENESIKVSITRQACTHTGGTATCNHKAVCTVCGSEYGELDKTNHAGETEVRDAKEATCGEAGYTGDTYCKDCGEELESGEVIAKSTTHTWDKGKVTKEATCIADGCQEYWNCSECGKKFIDEQGSSEVTDITTLVIPATGHTGGTATCTHKAVCTTCQQEYGELDTTNHSETELRDAKAATCKEEGYTGDTYCKACGEKASIGQAIAKSTAHTWNDGAVTKESTATEKGIKTYTCTVCGATQTEEIPALGGSTGDNSGNGNSGSENTGNSDAGNNSGSENTGNSDAGNNSGSENTGNSSTGTESAVNGYTTLEVAEKTLISANTDKGDVKDSTFANLQLKATGKKKSVTLTWKKVKGADGYILYGGRCGSSMKLLKTFSASKLSYTHTKLKQGKYYKYMVVAYKVVNGKKCIITSSKSAHAVTTGGKYANPTKVSVKSTKMTIKKGKKATIKATYVIPKGKKTQIHIAKFRYESSNTKVATVSKTGVVTAKKKGTVYIYVYAQNGIYKKVKVTVK